MEKCSCIHNIQKEVLEKFPEYNRKKTKRAVMEFVFATKDNEMIIVTSTTVNLTLEGQIKKVPITVHHRFCPFCGVEHFPKYKEAETEETGETEQKK